MPDRPTIISRKELFDLMQTKSDFELVEVLAPEEFEGWHLPGAINIPGDELRNRAPEMIPNKDKTIVVYCANPACTASDRAAELLSDLGYTDVRDFRGGKEHWKDGGFPVTVQELSAMA